MVPLQDIKGEDFSFVGKKAMGLAELMREGFTVPAGFCVTTEAFGHVRAALLSGGQGPESVPGTVPRLSLPKDMLQEIGDLYEKMFQGRPVAVRSSGIMEDLPEASFAGQYETYLNVVGRKALEENLRRCWASAWNNRVRAYCEKNGLPHEQMQLAVVVQEMVPAHVSGVLFTVNPLTGVDTEMMLEATWGLGEGLVSGKVNPDQFVLDVRSHKPLRSRIGEKRTKVARSEAGTCELEVDAQDRERPCLNEEQLAEIARVGRKVQVLYGAPQDIEFAYAEDRLHLLQTRPITTISFPNDMDEWTTADFRDGGVSAAVCSPFMWSLYDYVWRHSMPDYMKSLTLLKGEIDRDDWGKMFFGRPYWNVGAVKRCLFNIPGFNERNFDKDLSIEMTYEGDGVTTPVTPWGLIKAIPAVLALNKTYRKQLAFDQAYEVEFEEIEKRWDRLPIRELSTQELIPHYKELIEKIYFRMESNYFLTIFNQSNSKIDFKLSLDKLNGKGHGISYLNAISGIPHLRALMPLHDLWKLADRIVKEPGLKESMLDMDTREMADRVRASVEGQGVWAETRAYIEKYRYHSRTELDITVPRWDEDIEFVLETLKDYLRAHDETHNPEVLHQRQYELYLAEKEKAEVAFGKGLLSRLFPFSKRSFFKRMKLVRDYAWWREEMRDRSTRTYYLVRKYTIEIAHRWVREGLIREARDIFFLSFRQVFDVLEGRMTPEEADAIIQENKDYNASFRNFRNPNEIGSRWKIEEKIRKGTGGDQVLQGIGCSPGVTRGRVKVIRDISETHTLEQDDVLVTFFTDPGWTPVLNLVSAVITETGGLLSHAAIIAREYGIPAVLNVNDATALLRDNQTIEVDGDKGEVRIV